MSNSKFDLTFELFRREILARTHQNKRLYEFPVEEALSHGEVLGPTKVIKTSGELQSSGFQFKFRKGDRVKLCVLVNGKLEPIFPQSCPIQEVRFEDVGVARFRIDSPILDPNLEYFMVMDYNPVFDWSLRKRLMENKGVRSKSNIKAQFFPSMIEELNSAQQNAIESVLRNQFSGVIQGPPGTGKTEVLAKLVEIAEANGLRVGVLSFTNKAVDNALKRIAKTIDHGVYRVGDPLKVAVPEGVKCAPKLSMLKSFSVFGATTHTFLLSNNRPPVDIIILDEASQIPSFFLAGIKHSCSNIVMIGDHQQLPPVMQVGSYKDCAPDCFTFFKDEQKELPMLEVQYRMNETIQDWSSKHYYEGKLTPHARNAKRDHFSGLSTSTFGESVIQYVDSLNGSGLMALQVLNFAIEAQKLGNLNWEDIGIISPHRLHAAQINRKIQEHLGVEVNNKLFADTVDRYQGSEKEFIIFTASDSLSDPSAFLNDYRRINVAITRAKSRFYVVSDYRLREGEEFSDFLRWCKEMSDPNVKKAEAS